MENFILLINTITDESPWWRGQQNHENRGNSEGQMEEHEKNQFKKFKSGIKLVIAYWIWMCWQCSCSGLYGCSEREQLSKRGFEEVIGNLDGKTLKRI